MKRKLRDAGWLMLAGLTLFAALSVGPCEAQGQETTFAQPWALHASDHVCRVSSRGGWGSGTYLGNGFILTASHVFHARDVQGNISERYDAGVAYFRDGTTLHGVIVARDDVWDQALLQLNDTHPSLPGVTLASKNPDIGDQVYASGYDGGRPQLLWRPGVVTNYCGVPTTGPTDPNAGIMDWFSLNNAVKKGSSGGGVFNAAGELIGNLWGANQEEGRTEAVCQERTKRFLLPWNAKLEATRQLINAGRPPACNGWGCRPQRPQNRPQCPGGQCPLGGQPNGPTAPSPAPAPAIPPKKPCPCPNQGACIEEIATKIIAYIAANPDKFRGPRGEPGEPGDTDRVVRELLAYVEANPDQFRGPKGQDGKDGQDGRDGTDAAFTDDTLNEIADMVGIRIVAKVTPIGN